MEAHKIWLNPQDGLSIFLWATWLREEGALLAFKMSCNLPPLGSALAQDAFVMIIQTEYQRKKFRDFGHSFLGIDTTHNTTHYENVSLFTLIIRDDWGHS